MDLYLLLQPPKIKAFIDKVIQSPLPDIAIPLSGFRWEYGKVISFYLFNIVSLFYQFGLSLTCSWFSGEFSSLEAIVSAF